MKKQCAAHDLCCRHDDSRKVDVAVIVHVGRRELVCFCSAKCANDYLGEISDGLDNLARAVREGDVFASTKEIAGYEEMPRERDWYDNDDCYGSRPGEGSDY